MNFIVLWHGEVQVVWRKGKEDGERESNIITSLHPSYVAALRVVAGHYKDNSFKNMWIIWNNELRFLPLFSLQHTKLYISGFNLVKIKFVMQKIRYTILGIFKTFYLPITKDSSLKWCSLSVAFYITNKTEISYVFEEL